MTLTALCLTLALSLFACGDKDDTGAEAGDGGAIEDGGSAGDAFDPKTATPADTDADGTPDYLDRDSDDDGDSGSDELAAGSDPTDPASTVD